MRTLTDLIHDDLFPRERLNRMRSQTSRVETTHFIRAYHRRIHTGREVPYHWHEFASDILLNAAEALCRDYDTHKGTLADVMGLRCYDSKLLRNQHICFSIQQQIEQGSSLQDAFNNVSQRLREHNIPLEADTLRETIWPTRDEEWTETMAKELLDADFIEFLAPFSEEKNSS